MLMASPALYEPLITHRFSLGDINAAFDTALDKSSGSVKVHIGP
jgi:threonine dehydrogenase-like Zn-dependent dehydrogenase